MQSARHFLSRQAIPLLRPIRPQSSSPSLVRPHRRQTIRSFASSSAVFKSGISPEHDNVSNLQNPASNGDSAFLPDQANVLDFEQTHVIDPTVATHQVNLILAANQSLLELLHDNGLPWWATIIVATVCLRSAFTFPIALYQQRSVARMIALAPMVQSWGETLKVSVGKESKRRGMSYEEYNAELQKQYRAKVKQLYRQNDCSPLKSFLLPWVQIPLFISMSLTIRGMAAYPLPWLSNSNLPVEGFTDGGLAWFVDLTQVDPTWVFPLAIGATNLFNVELNAWFMKGNPAPRQRILRNIFRALSIAMVPIAAQAPMALCLYWVTSSSYSVVQNVGFRIPTVRKRLGLP